MSNFALFFLVLSSLITRSSFALTLSCGLPPNRSSPSNNYSIDDVTRDLIIFSDCVENKRGLFVIASYKGAVCVTEMPKGIQSIGDLLQTPGVKKLEESTFALMEGGKAKTVSAKNNRMPDRGESFTFYPIKAGSDSLILSESADCKTGKTYSAYHLAKPDENTPSCRHFKAGETSNIFFQYGSDKVKACKKNRADAKNKENVADSQSKNTSNNTGKVLHNAGSAIGGGAAVRKNNSSSTQDD